MLSCSSGSLKDYRKNSGNHQVKRSSRKKPHRPNSRNREACHRNREALPSWKAYPILTRKSSGNQKATRRKQENT
jgi:hypothetical protein